MKCKDIDFNRDKRLSKIAFIGNIASMSYLIARELIARGHDVDIFTFNDNIFQTNLFPNRSPTKKYGLPFERTIRRGIARLKTTYDVELRNSRTPMVSARYSVPIFHGSELRSGLMIPEYPCFYTTKDLVKYFDNSTGAKWLPRCADTAIFRPKPRPTADDEIIVGHFPSDSEIKGSNQVKAAVDLLNRRGIRVSLLMEKVAHEELPAKIAECHVICDWFNRDYGLYGILSIEALLMDRPVVCHVKDAYYDYPEIKDQIVSCSPYPEEIADKIVAGLNKKLDPNLVSQLYSPKRSADILISELAQLGILT